MSISAQNPLVILKPAPKRRDPSQEKVGTLKLSDGAREVVREGQTSGFNGIWQRQRDLMRRPVAPQATLKALTVSLQSVYRENQLFGQVVHELGRGDLIGGGAWGSVRACDNYSNVVWKFVKTRGSRNPERTAKLTENEIAILDELTKKGAPHVVPLLNSWSDKGCCYGISMLDGGKDIYQLYLDNKKATCLLPDLRATEIYFKRLLEALEGMHKNQIVHRDIKPENITEFLIDFNLAMKVPPEGIKGMTGTLRYCAPETLLGLSYNENIDVWAAACTIFFLYTGGMFNCVTGNQTIDQKQMKRGEINTLHSILNRLELESFPSYMVEESPYKNTIFQPIEERWVLKNPEELKPLSLKEEIQKAGEYWKENPKRIALFIDLLLKMLEVDPKKRISAAAALEHEFFTSNDSFDLSFKIEGRVHREVILRLINLSDERYWIEKRFSPDGSNKECLHIPRSKAKYRAELYFEPKPNKFFLVKSEKIALNGGEIYLLTLDEKGIPVLRRCLESKKEESKQE